MTFLDAFLEWFDAMRERAWELLLHWVLPPEALTLRGGRH